MAAHSTFWNQFLVQDKRTLHLMPDFPLHKFRTTPVAYWPMGGATMGGLVAAVYENGSVAGMRPTLHDVVEVDEEEQEERQERFLAAGVAGFGGELAVAVWDSTAQSYKADMYRVEKYCFKRVGSAVLQQPRPGEVLCGFAHTGGGLVCVWVDGSLQIYRPGDKGLGLMQSYKLTGFDFEGMRRKSGTEDLRGLPIGVSVCGMLGERDLVLVAGPNAGKHGLKYVMVDARTGMIQARGLLLENVCVEAPVKLLIIDAVEGRIRVAIGGEDLGEHLIHVRPNTLAGRLGSQASQPFPKKRKLNGDLTGMSLPVAIPDMGAAHQPQPQSQLQGQLRSVAFTLPPWAQVLEKGEYSSLVPARKKLCLERLPIAQGAKNGIVTDDHIPETVASLMSKLSSTEPDEKSIAQSLETLIECKQRNIVLTVDLPGMTAGAIVQLGCGWEKLETLIEACPLRSLSHCPNLPAKLVNASQFDLLDRIIGSIEHMSGEELTDVLHAIFSLEVTNNQFISQSDHYDRIATSAMASVSSAESCTLEELHTVLPRIQREVARVDRFSPMETLLHSVLRGPVDLASLHEAVRNLSPSESRRLMAYLSKWIEKHQRLLPLLDWDKKTESWCAPDRDTVVDWMAVLISCQITALSGSVQYKQVCDVLACYLTFVVTEISLLLPLHC